MKRHERLRNRRGGLRGSFNKCTVYEFHGTRRDRLDAARWYAELGEVTPVKFKGSALFVVGLRLSRLEKRNAANREEYEMAQSYLFSVAKAKYGLTMACKIFGIQLPDTGYVELPPYAIDDDIPF